MNILIHVWDRTESILLSATQFSVTVKSERMNISVNIAVLKTQPTRVRQPLNIVPRRKPSHIGRGNFRNPAPTYIQRENNRDQDRNFDL